MGCGQSAPAAPALQQGARQMPPTAPIVPPAANVPVQTSPPVAIPVASVPPAVPMKKPALRVVDKTYATMSQLQQDLAAAGLEGLNMIVGIDFTASNSVTGRQCRGGKNLHEHSPDDPSYYMRVVRLMTELFAKFDADGRIPVYGFGDHRTSGNLCFPLSAEAGRGLPVDQLAQVYERVVPFITLGGPTSFAALIAHACDIIAASGYHVLVVIYDGGVTDNGQTLEAIAQASEFPLSIILVGVGDGPFNAAASFDDVPRGKFDNTQFVQFQTTMNPIEFCKLAAAELVDQYTFIKHQRLNSPYPRPPLFTHGEAATWFPRPPTGFCIAPPVLPPEATPSVPRAV